MGVTKGELYTPLTEAIKLEIKRAALLDGGLTTAPLVWGIGVRSLFRILNDNKVVSLSWMDKFCTNAATEVWVTDFPWFTMAEMHDTGDWNRPDNTTYKQSHCKNCGRAIEDPKRRVYCSNACLEDSTAKARKAQRARKRGLDKSPATCYAGSDRT